MIKTMKSERSPTDNDGAIANDAMSSLIAIHRAVKQSTSPIVRKILYAAKDRLINLLISKFSGSDLVDMHYQFIGDRLFLVVCIASRPRKSFHMPVEKLSPTAEKNVIFELGYFPTRVGSQRS